MAIKYIRDGKTTIISEVAPEHQCRLLELIGLSLKVSKPVLYEFTEALEAFTSLAPKDKRKEINAWVSVMENILNRREHEENKKSKIRNICGLR